MHITPADLIARTGDLVSLPDIYIRVKSVMDDPDSPMMDLADVVAHDPALTARLLKLANSPFFGFAAKIDTINRAVNLLGTRQIHDLVLATTVSDAFARIGPNRLNIGDFWANSIHCGLLSKLLGAECGLVDAERFFVAGLLHDVGHLILDQVLPELCAVAFERAQQEMRPLYTIEREMIGCDYAEIGAALMESWSFPGGLVASTRYQNAPGAAGEFELDAALTHIAVCVVGAETLVGDDTMGLPAIYPAALETTGVTRSIVASVRETAAEHLSEMVALMFPNNRLCA